MNFSFQNFKHKKNTFYIGLLLIGLALFSCSSDDDTETPPPILEVNDCELYEPTPASGSINATWEMANERDVYANFITIPSDPGGGYVTVTLSQSATGLIPALFVDNDFDAGGTIIGGSAAQTNNVSNRVASFSVHPGASYSVEVYPFFNAADYPVDYTLEWEFFGRIDCFEQNDTQGQAKKILFDETIEAYAIAGFTDYFIASGDDKTYDWYKVELDEPSAIEVEVLDMPNDMRISMRLINTAGTLAGYDFDWLGAETSLNRGRLSKITSTSILNPGTYYIELHADFVESRKSNSDLDPIPEHFNTTYKIKAKKQQ
ncbi:hypothetical protein [Psychroserpens jangbogonensis]|uniref:hypothetical protein n=1 Tax=Psychroserpens jangbogonensis TaxID=1484460 RepID=UPI000AA9ADFE|nr:hypothetical protein [Psychroserpens jangbogonensis]